MLQWIRATLVVLLFSSGTWVSSGAEQYNPAAVWNLEELAAAPAVYPAPAKYSEADVKALFYEGATFQGKATRVFARYGLPKMGPGEKVPAMVLVHGGGGTAFAEWVRLWTARGYAAIAMDLGGTWPDGDFPNRKRHEYAGPSTEAYGLNQIDWPRKDQWCYHAICDVMLANSFLRAQPEIDPDRIGVTGISWGGYVTCIAAGVDARFRFAIPIYGCGFIYEDTVWSAVKNMGLSDELYDRWVHWWDPSLYLPAAAMPTLWVTGPTDGAYYFGMHRKSYRLVKGPRTLTIPVDMTHGHQPGWTQPESYAFADSICRGGKPLARITRQWKDGRTARIEFESAEPITKAELNYTTDSVTWPKRKWATWPAAIEGKNHAAGKIPRGTTAYYFNLFDARGFISSSEYAECGRAKE